MPQVSGDNVVWYGTDGNDSEVFLFDGVTTTQLNNNSTNESVPQISGENVVWQSYDGSDYEIFLRTEVVPDFSSNASFANGSDLDVLDIDFGIVTNGGAVAPIAFQIANLLSGDLTAELDLVGITGLGDTSVLTTDLAAFADLDAGEFLNFEAAIDTGFSGVF